MKKKLILTTLIISSLPIALSATDKDKSRGGAIKFEVTSGMSSAGTRFWTVTETRIGEPVHVDRSKRPKMGR